MQKANAARSRTISFIRLNTQGVSVCSLTVLKSVPAAESTLSV